MKILSKIIFALITLSFLSSASFAGSHSKTVTWKASHQFPGGKGDARDEMVQIIAKEVAKANVNFKIRPCHPSPRSRVVAEPPSSGCPNAPPAHASPQWLWLPSKGDGAARSMAQIHLHG